MKGDVLQIGICDDSRESLKQIESAVRDSIKKIGIQMNILFFLFQDGEDMCKAYTPSMKAIFLIPKDLCLYGL